LTGNELPERPRRGGVGGGRLGLILIGAVVIIVGAMIFIRLRGGPPVPEPPDAAGTAAIIAKVTSVPTATLDAVGAGTGVTPPSTLPDSTPPLLMDGKPEVLSIGAEFCPYCAAERWALAVALSRFGTFTNLGLTTSAADDVYPSTPTLTFHGASYASDLLAFASVETQTNQRAGPGQGYAPLETMTLEQRRLIQTYDAAPYTPSPGSIPFALIGNRYVISGSSYSPDVLQKLTWQQVADALSDPASPVARQVLGAANVLTGAICKLTRGQPATVCTSAGVVAGAAALPVK
jgi:hypothetical protein